MDFYAAVFYALYLPLLYLFVDDTIVVVVVIIVVVVDVIIVVVVVVIVVGVVVTVVLHRKRQTAYLPGFQVWRLDRPYPQRDVSSV